MASDLLSIASSGAQAARIALDVTAQNIANAGSEGYVRRSASMAEVAFAGGPLRPGDAALSGVRVDRIVRHADMFRQAEVRRTGADAARAGAEVAGLETVEAAIEQAGVHPAIAGFEASLLRLAGDPVNAGLRAAVTEDARTLANSFNVAAKALDSTAECLRFEAADGVAQVNLLAGELARVNLRLARAADASSDKAALMDTRDHLLQSLSGHADIAATFAADGTVAVRIGGANGPSLVSGGTSSRLELSANPDETIAFSLDGSAVALTGGALAGRALALDKLADTRAALDGIAAGIIAAANGAQASGSALDGTPGQPLFSGATAADMALALTSGAGLATAPAGAAAGSRDPANLAALRAALSATDPAGAADALLFDISATVAGRTVTRDALDTIAGSARNILLAQAGVDLDQEAVNLVRFQQAFQASGRAMQVASDIFDTLLGIR